MNEETACKGTLSGLCWYFVRHDMKPCEEGKCDGEDNNHGPRQEPDRDAAGLA